MKSIKLLVGALLLAPLNVVSGGTASAKEITVEMDRIADTGIGEKLGTVVIKEKQKGLSFEVDLSGIPPGEHGFHLHERSDCGPGKKDGKQRAGLAAGGHYDPAETKSHRGPTGNGHKGDLPFLTATDKGVNAVVTAPILGSTMYAVARSSCMPAVTTTPTIQRTAAVWRALPAVSYPRDEGGSQYGADDQGPGPPPFS